MVDRRNVLGGLGLGGALGLAGAMPAAARGQAGVVPPDTLGATSPVPPPGGVPGLELRHAFSLSIFFDERVRIRSDAGRVFVPVVGGEIWGPRLSGEVVPRGGADYAGANGLDASYMLRASDGALIYIRNRGHMKRLDGSKSPRVPAEPRMGGAVPEQSFVAPADSSIPLRMRLAPIFDAPAGPHEWLARTLIVGHGVRYTGPDHTIFTYYEVL